MIDVLTDSICVPIYHQSIVWLIHFCVMNLNGDIWIIWNLQYGIYGFSAIFKITISVCMPAGHPTINGSNNNLHKHALVTDCYASFATFLGHLIFIRCIHILISEKRLSHIKNTRVYICAAAILQGNTKWAP